LSEKKHIPAFIAFVLLATLLSCKSRVKTVHSTALSSKDALSKSKELNEVRFSFYYVNGVSDRMRGNYQESLKNFTECEKIEPLNPALRYELGMLHKLMGNLFEAAKNAKMAAELVPSNEWYHLLLIDCYRSAKQYNLAIKARETLIKNFPGRSDFKEDLAIEYAMAGQYEKSLKIYNELEKMYGVNEQLTLNKVKLLKNQKKHREAEHELVKLAATDPNETRFLSYLAELYMETGFADKGFEMYNRILAIDPSEPYAHLALYDYYYVTGKNNEAFSHLKKALMNPELDLNVKINIAGNIYGQAEKLSAKDKEQSLELAGILMKVHPDASEPKALYADFLIRDNKVNEASLYYYLASRKETRNYKVWQNLMYVYNELSRFDSLEKASAQAIELFPSQAECYLYNGVANMQLNNHAKAALSLKDGLSFIVDDNKQKLDFLRILADVYNTLKAYEKSDKAFDEALKIDPDNTYVLNNYAYYLSLRNSDLEKAEKLAGRAITIQPNERNYLDTYGWVLYKQRKYDEAEIWLSKAAAMGPKNPVILEHYGDVLFRLNKLDAALEQWKAAKEAGSQSPSISDKILKKKNPDE
jgi:tetratricopeptide (TPR) repeat protein